MSNKNETLAKDILNAVGGKENVTFVTHCMTRLRLNFKDRSIVTDEALNSIPGVVGVKWSNDQCQVIIGTTVNNVYDEFVKLGDFEQGPAVDENLDEKKEKEYSDKYIQIEQEDKIIRGYGFESNQDLTEYEIKNSTGIFTVEDTQPAPTTQADANLTNDSIKIDRKP